MADHPLPGIGLKGGWALGEDNWDVDMNANLVRASALIQGRALSQTTALPGSPTDGDIYIVPSGAGSHPNEIAVRDLGAWVYITPVSGWRMFVVDTRSWMTFDGTVWTNEVTSIADISASAVVNVSGAITLNHASGEIKRLNATADVTSISFVGWPAANTFARMIVELKANSHTITLPTSPDAYWPGSGSPPTVSPDNRWIFFTTDGGTTLCAATAWQGTLP